MNDRVVPADTLPDFRVADGDPDVRGWDVLAADGCRVGTVKDLLVDTDARTARYLQVDLDDDLVGDILKEHHILIPIGCASLDPELDRVRIASFDRTAVLGFPAYLHIPPATQYEETLRRRLEPDFGGTAMDADFFASPLYDQDHFYGPRRTLSARCQ